MKVALVTSSYLPHPGALERHVDRIARGLPRLGVQLELLTQDDERGLPSVSQLDGIVVRRFIARLGMARGVVAPGLWNYLRRAAASFDLVHVHGGNLSLGLAVAGARPRRFVFTPHRPILRLLRSPYGRAAQAIIERAVYTVCTCQAEADLLRRALPRAAGQVRVVPHGVDVAAIKAATPFPSKRTVVVTVGRLERYKRVDRAIAALAGLGSAFSLVVIGDGPARRRLQAYAADLGVSSRVMFAGSVPDAELYAWLRTARVVAALSEQQASGLQVLEAISAGASVVASATPVHRDVASYTDGLGVRLVSASGSPLDVASAISSASRIAVPSRTPTPVPAWDTVVAQTFALYEAAISGELSPEARIDRDMEQLSA
jgi:glycosyltransferase involved in cell wall biosynthesis